MIRLSTFLLALLITASCWAQNPSIPAAPELLIKHLPQPLEGWKTTLSRAQSNYNGEWLETGAKRSFERETEAGKINLTVQINDTGGFAKRLIAFKDFKEEAGQGFTKTRISGFPAIIMEVPDTGPVVQMLCHGRYEIQLVLSKGEMKDLSPWIKGINIAKLKQLPTKATEPEKIPRLMTFSVVDELYPDRSRTYETNIVTPGDRAKAAAAFEGPAGCECE